MLPVMLIFELVQEMMFMNACVKFCDNRLRNEVCREMMPFEYKRTNVRMYMRSDLYIPCEGIITSKHWTWVQMNAHI